MGFLSLFAHCVRCHQPFMSNPLRVPSILVNGQREPLCRQCVEAANIVRAARGLPTFEIFPDAYEPLDEAEGMGEDW